MVKQCSTCDQVNTGTTSSHKELEKEVANFKESAKIANTDETLVFLKSSAMLHQLLAVIRSSEMAGIEPDVIRETVAPVREILAMSPLVQRMQSWPRGYPGDFETIEWLCDGVGNQNNSGTHVLDNILLFSPPAQQHRNKILWQGNQVLSEVRKNPSAKILSIACGGSRDILSIAPYLSSNEFHMYLNDVDPDAIELSQQRMKGITKNLEIIRGDVFHSVRRLAKLGPFDLILAGGLFDYLDNRRAVWLLSQLKKLLSKDGSICFTNIAKGIPYNGWLDYLANWRLISRNTNDINDLLKEAGATCFDEINTELDATGHTLLVKYTDKKVPSLRKVNEKYSFTSITGSEALALTHEEKWERLSAFITNNGREAISYASLQHGMEYFVHELGYLAFITVKHPFLSPMAKRVVLGDPCCAEENYEAILSDFLKEYPNTVFGVISEKCAGVLRKLGFRANCIGCESLLDIRNYNTQGDWKNLDLIKRARNEARKKEITIREIDFNQETSENMKLTSALWLKNKIISDREIWFFARKPIYEYEHDARKFAAYELDGSIAGYVFYDPIYKDGKVIGYSATTPRTNESKYQHLTTAIHMAAMDIFREEGKEVLNLCLSPFTDMDRGIYNDDKFFKKILELTAKFGENIYNFKGLAFHKSKYRGNLKPIYLATKSRIPTNELYLAFNKADIANSYGTMILQLLGGIFGYYRQFLKAKLKIGKRTIKISLTEMEPKKTASVPIHA